MKQVRFEGRCMIPQGSQGSIVPLYTSVHVSANSFFPIFFAHRSGLCGVNLLRCPTLHLGDVQCPPGHFGVETLRKDGKG